MNRDQVQKIIAEMEFYLFNEVEITNGKFSAGYRFTSAENKVFNEELIQSWIFEKMKEVIAVRNRPHPFEMNLYYSL